MNDDIKTMQLYPRPDRIFSDLNALGYPQGSALPVDVVNRLDQLHYHGTDALDVAISKCGIAAGDQVLEVGSGWGGCARYIADATGAIVTAVELQTDYDQVARDLTARTNLSANVLHTNADFLELELPAGGFKHAVSWLALFHIPRRSEYLSKVHDSLVSEGRFFAEDLYLIKSPAADEMEDFRQHLFPNSLVEQDEYRRTMNDAGFDVDYLEDMTGDWTDFTTARLADFRQNRSQYEAIHSPESYATIETFYSKMAGYFARGLVGGLRFAALRRG